MNISINTLSVYGVSNPADAFPDMVKRGIYGYETWGIKPEEVTPLANAMKEFGTRLTCFCTNYFDLTNAQNRNIYVEELKKTLKAAELLNCSALITQVGQDTGMDRKLQHQSIVDGLKACVPYLEQANVTLMIEPLNTVKNHIGYYLDESREGFDIVKEVDSKNVKVLFDIYHQLHMQEPVLDMIKEGFEHIAHFHVAGYPERDDQISTNFNYADAFALADALGFTGYFGMELWPVNGNYKAFLDSLIPYIR